MKDYYSRQLQPIIDSMQKNPDDIVTIKVHSESYDTKYLSLNLDSVESLKAFLDIANEILEEQNK